MAGELPQLMATLILGAIVSMLLVTVYLTKFNPTYMRTSQQKYPKSNLVYRDTLTIDRGQEYTRNGRKSLMIPPTKPTIKLVMLDSGGNITNFANVTVSETNSIHNLPLSDEHRVSELTGKCSPKKNIVLLKTHKTGSSTIQNILYRFGENHELTFALPSGGSNYFCENTLFSRRCVKPLSDEYQYNILANHARLMMPEFQAIMPEDTMYITILRDPATQYESLYSYYKWKNVFLTDFQNFAKDPKIYYEKNNKPCSSGPHHGFRNPTLYDLGLTSPVQGTLRKEDVFAKINSLEDQFHLVLIMEHLEESIILLKDLMCWSWEEVLYFQTNSRERSQVDEMTKEVREKLILFNEGDWILYRHFNETLWSKVRGYGEEKMRRDVDTLRRKIHEKKEKCIERVKNVVELQHITIKRFQLTEEGSKRIDCKQMIRPALTYLQNLNKKMSLIRKRSEGRR